MINYNPFKDNINLSPNLQDAARQILEARLIPGTRIGDSRGPYVGGSRGSHEKFIRGFSTPKERSSRMRSREELDAIDADKAERKKIRDEKKTGRTWSGKTRIAAGMSPSSGPLTSDEIEKLRIEKGIAINLPNSWDPESNTFNIRPINTLSPITTLGKYSTTYRI